jgi:hypothetical protein
MSFGGRKRQRIDKWVKSQAQPRAEVTQPSSYNCSHLRPVFTDKYGLQYHVDPDDYKHELPYHLDEAAYDKAVREERATKVRAIPLYTASTGTAGDEDSQDLHGFEQFLDRPHSPTPTFRSTATATDVEWAVFRSSLFKRPLDIPSFVKGVSVFEPQTTLHAKQFFTGNQSTVVPVVFFRLNIESGWQRVPLIRTSFLLALSNVTQRRLLRPPASISAFLQEVSYFDAEEALVDIRSELGGDYNIHLQFSSVHKGEAKYRKPRDILFGDCSNKLHFLVAGEYNTNTDRIFWVSVVNNYLLTPSAPILGDTIAPIALTRSIPLFCKLANFNTIRGIFLVTYATRLTDITPVVSIPPTVVPTPVSTEPTIQKWTPAQIKRKIGKYFL